MGHRPGRQGQIVAAPASGIGLASTSQILLANGRIADCAIFSEITQFTGP